jgi:hypothetical protein
METVGIHAAVFKGVNFDSISGTNLALWKNQFVLTVFLGRCQVSASLQELVEGFPEFQVFADWARERHWSKLR